MMLMQITQMVMATMLMQLLIFLMYLGGGNGDYTAAAGTAWKTAGGSGPTAWSAGSGGSTGPIKLHPDNGHYFLFRSRPTVLITSGEHFGAVINGDFDYIAYLDELKSKNLNYTRAFIGPYHENDGWVNMQGNTLGPSRSSVVLPWVKSGDKYDLTAWNDTFFSRLKDFVNQAGSRGIVIELSLFCPYYDDEVWGNSPFNPANTIQGYSAFRNDVFRLDAGELLSVEEAYVRKVITELNGYDNIFYEVMNEPYVVGIGSDWEHHIISIITDTERSLPNKHLISQNIANGSAPISNPHPATSIFNFHYANPPEAVAENYSLNKVIGDDETGFNGTDNEPYRKEGWNFIMAGGGLFNNLDFSFTTHNPTGDADIPSGTPGGGGADIRQSMGALQSFISGVDFVHMVPDNSVITSGSGRALVKPGEAYLIYGFGNIGVNLPAGSFVAEWINVHNGNTEKMETMTGESSVNLASSTGEIAVRIKKTP